jgi:hypothetical protein
MNGNKFATGQILKKTLEVVKGRVSKSPKPLKWRWMERTIIWKLWSRLYQHDVHRGEH